MNIDLTETYNKVKELNKKSSKNEPKFIIFTMGCQQNENDSQKIAGMLKNSGYSKTEAPAEADVIVFNTCCVRENAENALLGKLGEVKKYKEEKGTIIAIGGCMMQEKNMVEKINKSYPFVDIIFGTHTLENFLKDLVIAIDENRKIEDVIDTDGDVYEGIPVDREDKVKASVTIMKGCNKFCTYCIVPYVRGRERSRNPQDIINEVECLAKQGYKEIMLLGQNVNSYLVSEKQKDKDLSFEVTVQNEKMIVDSFATLLRALNKIDGIEFIRFISPHPRDFTDDVIDAIADCDKVCNMIHFPLQAGSSKILKTMNRNHTKEQYLERVEKIKAKIPDICFTTDIIVGFPGETEEDFEDTLDVVRKVKFEQIFMFIYSRRVGTPADRMENQVPEEVKHERFERLKKLYEEQFAERNQEYIGKTFQILVEGKSKTNDKMLTGRTYSNRILVFEGNEDLIGQIVPIKVEEDHMWYLQGKVDKI